MPLILAIERDRHQAARLAAIVRSWPDVELCQARAAADGIRALDGRIPDLVLTSPLLSSRDEGLLAEHMRALGSAGSHVQTVRIPILGGSVSDGGGGLLGLLRRGRVPEPAQDGCDPDVFAREISEYLERARGERVAAAASADEHARSVAAAGTSDDEAQDDRQDTPLADASVAGKEASAPSILRPPSGEESINGHATAHQTFGVSINGYAPAAHQTAAVPINGHASTYAEANPPADDLPLAAGWPAAAGSPPAEPVDAPEEDTLAEARAPVRTAGAHSAVDAMDEEPYEAEEEVLIELSPHDASAAVAAVAERILRLTEQRIDDPEPAHDSAPYVPPAPTAMNGYRQHAEAPVPETAAARVLDSDDARAALSEHNSAASAPPPADWSDPSALTGDGLTWEEPPGVSSPSDAQARDPFGGVEAPFVFDASAFLVSDDTTELETPAAPAAQAPAREDFGSRADTQPQAAAPAIGNGRSQDAVNGHAAAPTARPETAPTAGGPAPPAIQDEWGFFDPARCGFAALADALEDAAQNGSRAPGAATPVTVAASPRTRSVVATERRREPTHA